jgi:hypothetical protein
MLQERRLEKRPDITFDLDGDGMVNHKDLALAKHFDKDGDGRLNTAEKEAAMKAIKEGFESKFLWGLEQTGGLKEHIRIVQKRGKVLAGEDFGPLTETYPVHPLSLEPRRHLDQGDMLKKRKEGLNDEMEQERLLWEKVNPYFVDRKWLKPEGYQETPLYTSVSQMLRDKRRNARIKGGLTAEPKDIKGSHEPTTAYINSPTFNCKSELNLHRKKSAIKEAKKSEVNMEHFRDMKARYLEREDYNIITAMESAGSGDGGSGDEDTHS